MQKSLLLALAFVVPCLSHVLLQMTLNAFTTGACWDPFEPRGSAWLAIKSIYYGTIGLLAGAAIYLVVKPPGGFFTYFTLACAIFVLGHFAFNGTLLSRDYFAFADKLGAVQKKTNFHRWFLFESKKVNIGQVTDIVVENDTQKVVVAGEEGAILAHISGTVESQVKFDSRCDTVSVIKPINGNGYNYYCRGSWAIEPRLMDHEGKTIWQDKSKSGDKYGAGTYDSVCADINGDGRNEFFICHGGSGAELLDLASNGLWHNSGAWQVEAIEPSKDQSARLVVTSPGDGYTLLNTTGGVVRRLEAPGRDGAFTLCRYPRGADEQCILEYQKGKLNFIDFKGKTLLSLPGPRSNEKNKLDKARCVPFRVSKHSKNFLAVLSFYSNGFTERTVLSIYNPNNELVYEEIIPENCSSLATVMLPNVERELLLVGGNNKVWVFEGEIPKQ